MKPVHFLASSLETVRKFPKGVREEVGFSLFLAQRGQKAINTVPMVGFGGASVLEVVVAERGNAYRAIYTVRFAKAIYVLHAFQKKSKHGAATPLPDMRLIHQRLSEAENHYRTTHEVRTVKESANAQGAPRRERSRRHE